MASWFCGKRFFAFLSSGARVFTRLSPLVQVGFLAAGCTGLYPEISTPLKSVPLGVELEPPPPKDMLFIAFRRAEIPQLTRDGRRWDELGQGAPDSFAMIVMNGRELMRTDVEADSFAPTWKYSAQDNYIVPPDASLVVQLWEQNSMVDHPICSKEIRHPHEEAQGGSLLIACEGGAEVELELQPAKPQFGLGLSYELRAETVVVTRTLARSPAERAGLKRGDVLLRVMGQTVKAMSEAQLRTAINANSPTGLKLAVQAPGGAVRNVELKDGPIYSLAKRKL